MAKQEGVIKFTLDFTPGDALPADQLTELNAWRDVLYARQLIGQDPTRYGGYGTPEVAAEVARLFAATHVGTLRVFSMGGHEDGIVSFGRTAAEAGDVLLAALAEAEAIA